MLGNPTTWGAILRSREQAHPARIQKTQRGLRKEKRRTRRPAKTASCWLTFDVRGNFDALSRGGAVGVLKVVKGKKKTKKKEWEKRGSQNWHQGQGKIKDSGIKNMLEKKKNTGSVKGWRKGETKNQKEVPVRERGGRFPKIQKELKGRGGCQKEGGSFNKGSPGGKVGESVKKHSTHYLKIGGKLKGVKKKKGRKKSRLGVTTKPDHSPRSRH